MTRNLVVTWCCDRCKAEEKLAHIEGNRPGQVLPKGWEETTIRYCHRTLCRSCVEAVERFINDYKPPRPRKVKPELHLVRPGRGSTNE